MDEIKLAKVSYQLNQCDRVQCSQGHTSATTVEHLAGLPRRRCESSIAGAGHSEIDGKGAPPAPFPWATGYSAHTGGVLRPRKGGSTPRNPRPLMRNQNMRIECKVNKFRAALSSHPKITQNPPTQPQFLTVKSRPSKSVEGSLSVQNGRLHTFLPFDVAYLTGFVLWPKLMGFPHPRIGLLINASLETYLQLRSALECNETEITYLKFLHKSLETP